jgi:hypothetical protein
VGSINRLVGISQHCRRKHFSALAREAFLITESWEASTVLLAFRSAFAGSISHRQGGREASAYAGISQRFRWKHFTSSLWTGSISQRRGREASAYAGKEIFEVIKREVG